MNAKITYILFLIFFSYFAVLMLYYIVLSVLAFFEGRRRAREYEREDLASFLTSSFILPVSIIIPAHNEEEWIADSIKSVLNINYPAFEAIVIDDGSTDKTLEILSDILKLQPVDRTYVERFQAGKIREIFKSEKYPNVTVISKHAGQKKAGALNAGLNLAKHKYVCVIDSDTILEPDAFLKIMPHIQKDPENIIGVGSFFGLVNCFKIKDGKIIEKNFTCNWLIAYQHIEYVRTFIGNRIAWSRLNVMPNIAGGFGLWRRDILLELGGYSPDFSCEDIEFTFRAQDYIAETNKNYKILSLPYCVGWTEGPSDLASLISQRNRWQRVVIETVWHYKHIVFKRGHGLFAFILFPYFLFYEVLGVFFEISSVALAAWGYFAKVLDLRIFFIFFLFMILSNTFISLASLFIFVRDQKIFKTKDIIKFVILSFLEFFWYRWIISIAKLAGTLDYLKGVKIYDSYARKKRNK